MSKRSRRVARDAGWVEQVLLDGCVALTDVLVAELVADGWDRAVLERWRAEGAMWDRRRKSVVMVGFGVGGLSQA